MRNKLLWSAAIALALGAPATADDVKIERA